MNKTDYSEKTARFILIAVAAGSLSNAAWMLLFPSGWFDHMPALVPEYGTFNVHFVRDIGCSFLTIGVTLWWGLLKPKYLFPVAVFATLFYSAHALVHVFDTLRGHVGAHHWWVDFPTSYLPAIALCWVSLHLYRSEQN
ncbi:MAG: hypothetical protein OEZ39_04835 [Gammaproteobacteria bacterium]|nr:hypothetical protein [Gammaproteobacteria bacterium]MDH5651184.1 hypothetical protein [Gammaproteobacteria bacterium]